MLSTLSDMNNFVVIAIDPDRLHAMRVRGRDEHGNAWVPHAAEGGEPLRCCLTEAHAGVPIALISYQPLAGPSPWAEVGPVFVHAERCRGYRTPDIVPPGLDVGPRVLRTYNAANELDYDHIRLLGDGEPVAPALREIFATTDVATVHVRAVQAQCFTYAVASTRAA